MVKCGAYWPGRARAGQEGCVLAKWGACWPSEVGRVELRDMGEGRRVELRDMREVGRVELRDMGEVGCARGGRWASPVGEVAVFFTSDHLRLCAHNIDEACGGVEPTRERHLAH